MICEIHKCPSCQFLTINLAYLTNITRDKTFLILQLLSTFMSSHNRCVFYDVPLSAYDLSTPFFNGHECEVTRFLYMSKIVSIISKFITPPMHI